jgi:hypothetical protein
LFDVLGVISSEIISDDSSGRYVNLTNGLKEELDFACV